MVWVSFKLISLISWCVSDIELLEQLENKANFGMKGAEGLPWFSPFVYAVADLVMILFIQ
jgi:hypothetical protein